MKKKKRSNQSFSLTRNYIKFLVLFNQSLSFQGKRMTSEKRKQNFLFFFNKFLFDQYILSSGLQVSCLQKNMILKDPIFFFIAIFLLPSITAQSSKCNRSCGDKLVPFPFGFSAGCQIPLNCSSNNQQLVAGFPVLSINADRIKISIEATCNRPLQALHRLYGPNYAPTSQNAILLQNCSLPKPCMIPMTTVYTHFEEIACSPNITDISCYSENIINGFVDYDNVTRTNCKSFLSSISAESFNESGLLEVQVVELGWWLQGRCSDICSENASCDEIVPPVNGQPGVLCSCKHGFIGDGYSAAAGCRKGQFFYPEFL